MQKDSRYVFAGIKDQFFWKFYELFQFPGKTRFCRDAQTVEEKREHQQTNYNTSTQMTGIDVYVSNGTDKLMTPGRYETADEFLGKRQDAVS